MRSILFLSITFFVFCYPAFGELTAQDLEQIRLIVREDVRAIVKDEIAIVRKELKDEIAIVRKELKDEITASEKRVKEYVDVKFEGVEGKLTLVVGFITALIVLIVVTVGIPQILLAWRGKSEREQDKRIKELAEEIEALKQQRIATP